MGRVADLDRNPNLFYFLSLKDGSPRCACSTFTSFWDQWNYLYLSSSHSINVKISCEKQSGCDY